MKFLKAFMVMALVLTVFILGGCSYVTISENTELTDIKQVAETLEEKSAEVEAAQESVFGVTGTAIDVEDTAYYWKFTSDDFQGYGMFYGMVPQVENTPVTLVSYHDGVETPLAETETADRFVVTDKKLYYNDNDAIVGINLDGSDAKVFAEGHIRDVTEDGKYILFDSKETNGLSPDLYSFSADTGEVFLLASSSDIVGVHDNRVFYIPDSLSFDYDFLSLYSVNPDGSDKKTLFTSDKSEYTDIAHIRFTDEYVYFSYGYAAGSAYVYQGGDIVRVKYDGTDAEILAEHQPQKPVYAAFGINADGSITNYVANEVNDAYFTFRDTHYSDEDGNLIWFDTKTGEPINVSSCFPDENYDISLPDEMFVNVTDNYIFFVTHHGNYDHENSSGWRDAYTREKSVFYMIDRETEEIVTSYEF